MYAWAFFSTTGFRRYDNMNKYQLTANEHRHQYGKCYMLRITFKVKLLAHLSSRCFYAKPSFILNFSSNRVIYAWR